VLTIGSPREKSFVERFFFEISQIPSARRQFSDRTAAGLLRTLAELRRNLDAVDEVRKQDNVKLKRRRGVADLVKPYEGIVLIALTIMLVVLALIRR
jgi:hypothetical protein